MSDAVLTIAADFAAIPFPDHEARTLACAYLVLLTELKRAEARVAKADALADALRTSLTWLVRPSDIPGQHAESLIRATEEIRAALAGWYEEVSS